MLHVVCIMCSADHLIPELISDSCYGFYSVLRVGLAQLRLEPQLNEIFVGTHRKHDVQDEHGHREHGAPDKHAKAVALDASEKPPEGWA